MTPPTSRTDRHGRPLPPKPNETPATNVPCENCNRRGWRDNPVRFRRDVPGHFCDHCHRESRA